MWYHPSPRYIGCRIAWGEGILTTCAGTIIGVGQAPLEPRKRVFLVKREDEKGWDTSDEHAESFGVKKGIPHCAYVFPEDIQAVNEPIYKRPMRERFFPGIRLPGARSSLTRKDIGKVVRVRCAPARIGFGLLEEVDHQKDVPFLVNYQREEGPIDENLRVTWYLLPEPQRSLWVKSVEDTARPPQRQDTEQCAVCHWRLEQDLLLEGLKFQFCVNLYCGELGVVLPEE